LASKIVSSHVQAYSLLMSFVLKRQSPEKDGSCWKDIFLYKKKVKKNSF
jgi:hypothetical protein